jgi:hypothetical protein
MCRDFSLRVDESASIFFRRKHGCVLYVPLVGIHLINEHAIPYPLYRRGGAGLATIICGFVCHAENRTGYMSAFQRLFPMQIRSLFFKNGSEPDLSKVFPCSRFLPSNPTATKHNAPFAVSELYYPAKCYKAHTCEHRVDNRYLKKPHIERPKHRDSDWEQNTPHPPKVNKKTLAF